MNILPIQTLSEHEEQELMEVLRYPILRKYFSTLAHNLAYDMVAVGIDDSKTPESYLRTQAFAKGQLSLLEDLANAITAASSASSAVSK